MEGVSCEGMEGVGWGYKYCKKALPSILPKGNFSILLPALIRVILYTYKNSQAELLP